ncbi:MAG: porin family protein [Afipia felis]|nr:porin family protein [Afipia felis]
MKKSLFASAVLVLMGSAASAADLPARTYTKAPAYVAPIPVYNWTGVYVGGNLGYGWGKADSSILADGAYTAGSIGLVMPVLSQTTEQWQNLSGVVGGGQIGFNYQFHSDWLLGIETDLQGSSLNGRTTTASPINGVGCTVAIVGPPPSCFTTGPFTGSTAIETVAKINWFGTLRARVGFLSQDQTLFYATGGLAYGHIDISGYYSGSADQTSAGSPVITPFSGSTLFNSSKMKAGFAVGGGIEGRFRGLLPDSWTWKAEYLYVDLGTVGVSSPIAMASGRSTYSDVTGTMTSRMRLTENIVRLGINHRFSP